jgi:RHS repeat-associated protein
MTVAEVNQSTVATYAYNALGERISKTVGSSIERYNYGPASKLQSEYGATNREYVYVDGIPVANLDIQGATTSIAYVTADQLGTPRAISDSAGNTVWAWSYQGNVWGEQSPTSNGYSYNLRLPGQYYDAETGLNYNINRYYEPGTGRYGQVDPLGQFGGQSSVYAYVSGNPLRYTDSLGLQEYDPVEERDDEFESWIFRGRLAPLPPPETEMEKEGRWQQCPRPNRFPENDSQLKHIFRDAPGHIDDTQTNRDLLENLTNNVDDFDGLDRFGNSIYTRPLGDGSDAQVWAITRDGVIQNGGINTQPWTYVPNYGLIPGK